MGVSLLGRLFRRNRTLVSADAGVATRCDGSDDAPAVWTLGRLAQAEALWGEGFLWPGGADEIRRLVAPFGLSAAHALLLVGVGVGGPARMIAADLGVWVSSYEADPELVEVATRRLQRAGVALAKRATVARWWPEVPAFPARGFDHGLALEALGGPDPEAALAALAGAIKPGGRLVVVQSVPDGVDPAWIATALVRLGCDVGMVEDETGRHANQVLRGWKLLVRGLRGSRPGAVEAAALVAEAEHWLRRLRLIREGRLRLLRWGVVVR